MRDNDYLKSFASQADGMRSGITRRVACSTKSALDERLRAQQHRLQTQE
jgi:hypothetical protein